MRLKIISLYCALLFLSGCATTELSLTKDAQREIKSADSTLMVPQNNLLVRVNPVQLHGFGIIGAVVGAAIDSSRTAEAEKTAQPITEKLKDYNFRQILLTELDENFRRVIAFKITKTQVSEVNSESFRRIKYDKSVESAVLFINCDYSLGEGGLSVVALAELFPKTEGLKKFRKQPDDTNPLATGNAIYRKTFRVARQGVSELNIKTYLSESAASIAKQLADDLDHGL
ncbi:hypothetical protein [Ottowia testudinis]|uniref:Lipoprotein n=1 Tax=Ottowia testudinis TaxID=2816950 RepID=A0A975CI34_9BURK|nr:hypothetical protein [Ottowia testudinis]QTD43798.1 hypothetical protein J1M35_11605 [Ottowia testudinis]